MLKLIQFLLISVICSQGLAQYGYKNLKPQPPKPVTVRAVVCSVGDSFSLMKARLMIADSQVLVFYKGRLEVLTDISESVEVSFWRTNQKNLNIRFSEHQFNIHDSRQTDDYLSASLNGPYGYEKLTCTQLNYE